MLVILLFAMMTTFIILHVPIVIAVGSASLVYLILSGNVLPITAVQRMAGGVNSYTLLSIPFFIFAGNIMNHGGVTTRIFNFANACVGHVRGGLAHVNVLASIIFAGMSGTAVADAGGLGAIEIKAMTEKGYGEKVTVGVTAASSLIGPIIPPSMVMVVYGVSAGASLGRLFAAGVVPGLVMGLALMALIYWKSEELQCPTQPRASFKVFLSTFISAFPSLMAPVIILGGIFTGWFTPTESAAVASLYAYVLGLVYGDITWENTKESVISSLITTVQILMIVASATLFAYIMTTEQVPQIVTRWILGFTTNYWLILFMLNIMLLVVGMFMETVASINLIVPICLPLFKELNIDPVHFGVVMCVNLVIGALTPPFGTVLFVLSSVSNISVEKVSRYTAYFLPPLFLSLFVINAFPKLSLWLPNLLFGVDVALKR